MAPIALTQKDRCQGFSHDHRQCRLRRNKGATCKIHQNYFVNWFVTHPSGIPGYRSSRQIYEYEYVLKNRLVKIPQDHMDFLQNVWINLDNYSEYLIFIAKYSDYDLLRVPRALKYYTNKWCTDIINYILTEELIKSHVLDTIGIFLTNHKVSLEILMYIIETLMNQYVRSHNLVELSLAHIKERFLCIMYVVPQWKQLLFSQDLVNLKNIFIEKFGKLSQLKEAFFTQVVDTVMEGFNSCHKFVIYYNIYKLKRELIAEVLHPDRIQKLILAHGMDILDHM